MKDYYLILGLPKTATPAEIDTAFRRLARKYHPDVKPTERDALARFKAAKEAHDVLSDVEKRREYDRQRTRARRHATRGKDLPGSSGQEFGNRFGAWTKIPGKTPRNKPAAPRGAADVEAELRLTPEEALRGGPLEVRISLRRTCSACDGQSGNHVGACEVCNGRGTLSASQVLQLWLPPNLHEGTALCLAGYGEETGSQAPRGDLYLLVRVRPCW